MHGNGSWIGDGNPAGNRKRVIPAGAPIAATGDAGTRTDRPGAASLAVGMDQRDAPLRVVLQFGELDRAQVGDAAGQHRVVIK